MNQKKAQKKVPKEGKEKSHKETQKEGQKRLVNTTEYRSFYGTGITTIPRASSLKGCKRLELSNNPLTSLESLETIPTLTELRLNDTLIESFVSTNPQPELTDLYISGKHTPISHYPFLELMAICVFSTKLKRINGELIKKPIREAGRALSEGLAPHLRKGWLVTVVSPIIRGVHYKTMQRKNLPVKIKPEQPIPIPEPEPETPKVKINFRRASLRPVSGRENKSENGDSKERKTRIPVFTKPQKRSRSLTSAIADALNPSNVCVSPSKSVESFTEVRDSEAVVIENSSLFPPIKSVNNDDLESVSDHCPSDIDDLVCPASEDEECDTDAGHFIGVTVVDSDVHEYKEATLEDLMAAYQQEMVPMNSFAFMDDASSVISCSTTASGISRTSRCIARRKFNIDDLRAEELDDDSDMSDIDPRFYFKEDDLQPEKAKPMSLAKKPSTVKFSCLV